MNPRWLAWSLLAIAPFAVPLRSRAEPNVAQRAQALIAGLDLAEANAELAAADPEDPAIALERARLALYELDCDGAVTILGRPEVQKTEAGEQLADIARGCQRATAALVVDRDEPRGIEVRWQDENDRAMGPLLFDTVESAREALTRDLGVDWPRPTRIVVVRDLLSLAAMTGLPYKSAQTTGTVAVAKWGRVTILSPRANNHGYVWRDTVAHELTHLAVTRLTRDRAPLWLQEGIAKREEVRWRDPGPFDDRPPADAIVQRGEELHLGLALDKLGPSIAMLPSADAASVAFAEVTSFVRFYVQSQGDDALSRLLAKFREGAEPSQALSAASGTDLKGWDAKWRASMAMEPRLRERGPLPLLLGGGIEPGAIDRWRKLRDRSRLAELLLARGHAAEALTELDRDGNGNAIQRSSTAPEAADPGVRWLRARALESAGKREEGEWLVSDPMQVLSSYGPWWAIRGRWARLGSDEVRASQSFAEAVAADPLDPEAACETLDSEAGPADPAKASLCAAARSAAGPPFDDN
jgi:Peptidase MA superfamily